MCKLQGAEKQMQWLLAMCPMFTELKRVHLQHKFSAFKFVADY